MNAQEAIEISEKELKAYKEGLWRYKGEKEYEQHVAVGDALWILLELSKILIEGDFYEAPHDAAIYIDKEEAERLMKLKEGESNA